MRKILVLTAALAALTLPGAAGANGVAIYPSEDVGLPFRCDWGYDWDERCYRDDGPRLPVGGVDDKVWRSAFRFSLAAVPRGATITSATLWVFHDGTCVAPRLTSVACGDGAYTVDVHRILSRDWYRDQEPAFDGRIVGRATLAWPRSYAWLGFDLTTLVREWFRGTVSNDGVLLKLVDATEGFGTSGPYLASSTFPYVPARPVLAVYFNTGPTV